MNQLPNDVVGVIIRVGKFTPHELLLLRFVSKQWDLIVRTHIVWGNYTMTEWQHRYEKIKARDEQMGKLIQKGLWEMIDDLTILEKSDEELFFDRFGVSLLDYYYERHHFGSNVILFELLYQKWLIDYPDYMKKDDDVFWTIDFFRIMGVACLHDPFIGVIHSGLIRPWDLYLIYEAEMWELPMFDLLNSDKVISLIKEGYKTFAELVAFEKAHEGDDYLPIQRLI